MDDFFWSTIRGYGPGEVRAKRYKAEAERDELRVEVERLGGLLDEVQDLCKVQENFPFRGHLEDILAKRNQGKDGE